MLTKMKWTLNLKTFSTRNPNPILSVTLARQFLESSMSYLIHTYNTTLVHFPKLQFLLFPKFRARQLDRRLR